MGIGLSYNYTAKIIDPAIDDYGADKIGQLEYVDCIFYTRKGTNEGNNQENITTSAIAYVDPLNSYISSNIEKLVGMYFIATRQNSSEADSWYRIINVTVGEDKLLEDEIDNIRLDLQKTVGIPYVS